MTWGAHSVGPHAAANHANGKAKSAASKDKVLNKIKSEEVGARRKPLELRICKWRSPILEK
jgi:hypothetical protein